MKIGIDFGTTRIVVAAADRGNYPLVGFEGPDGEAREWFPSLMAVNTASRELIFGWDISRDGRIAHQEAGWTVVRSLKRWLKDGGPETQVEIGGRTFPLLRLLTEMARALYTNLRERSSLPAIPDEPLEVMLGVPAHANTNQRFMTTEAFRAAGFVVLGLLNEPSAASIEFGHRNRTASKDGLKSCLLVYDLGGGTFDASLVEMDEHTHSVIASTGLPTLGGDDFDEILAELAIETAGLSGEEGASLSQAESYRLQEECRDKKEALHPNTRKIAIDLERVRAGWGEVSIPVGDFYDRCRPAVEETRTVIERLLADYPHHVETLYVTGGGSELPLVARVLRESFGKRVRRSAYMRSATAIGLAIHADAKSDYVLKERFAENFGVWRETDDGNNVAFDLLFPRGTRLPAITEPPLRRVRSYFPAHNIGHFRYLECAELNEAGLPVGDITVWDDIYFPFDGSLRGRADLASLPVHRNQETADGQAEEIYTCDASGAVAVSISHPDGGKREYRLGSWSGNRKQAVSPGLRTRAKHRHKTSGRGSSHTVAADERGS